MKLKQLIAKLQELQKQGSGVDDNWPVYLYDGLITKVKVYPSDDGCQCHIADASELVLEFETAPKG